MAQRRWLDPSRERCSTFYHVINRVVDRRFVLGSEEKEKFRMFMRMAENFSGCRVLSYCVMSNHFHLLLEVPPKITKVGRFVLPLDSPSLPTEVARGCRRSAPGSAISEEEFFKRLRELYSDAVVEGVRAQVEDAHARNHPEEVARIFNHYAYRMHDLSEYMKTLAQRFSSWFNRSRERKGRLWEQRFKSLIVEDGIAARTIAAYIDLNPVRAGMVQDAADYRWSSYGEAVAGGKKARAGLVRALGGKNPRKESTDENVALSLEEFDAKKLVRVWSQGGVGKRYRSILLGRGEEKVIEARVVRKGMSKEKVAKKLRELEIRKSDLAISEVVRHRVRYFSDGVVLGGKDFVEEVFQESRERFGTNRESGARKPRGALGVFAQVLWTARDLRKE